MRELPVRWFKLVSVLEIFLYVGVEIFPKGLGKSLKTKKD